MIAEISVNISFLKHTLTKSNECIVVEGDYNTTKLVFNFEEDVSEKRLLFKMGNPFGEVVLLKDLEDNEITLVGEDEDGQPCSLFPVFGVYPFELVCYGENSKITSATGWLNVSKRQVVVLDEVVTQHFPLFDKLCTVTGVFLRFSAHEDGSDFTEEYSSGQNYVGIASGQSAPTEKEGYQWMYMGNTQLEQRMGKVEKDLMDIEGFLGQV